MSAKQESLSKLDTSYQEFVDAVRDLDELEFESKIIDGRWGVRELAAHLAGWHGQFAGGFERLARGEQARSSETDWRDVDGLNHTFAQHAKGKRKDEVLLELARAVGSLKKAADKLPEDHFQPDGMVDKMMRKGGYEHFQEHTQMVRELLQEHARA